METRFEGSEMSSQLPHYGRNPRTLSWKNLQCT